MKKRRGSPVVGVKEIMVNYDEQTKELAYEWFEENDAQSADMTDSLSLHLKFVPGRALSLHTCADWQPYCCLLA